MKVTITSDTIPTEWPGAFGLFKYSRAAMLPNIWTVVGLYLASVVASLALQLILKDLGRVLSEIISVVIGVAIIQTIFAGVRGEEVAIDDALKLVKPMMAVNYFLNALLVTLALIVSLVALFIPFFFVLPRIILAPYLLVDRNLGPIEAIKQSWELSRGHSGKIWGIIGASLGMALLCFVIIGIYFLVLYAAALAITCLFLSDQTQAGSDATTPKIKQPADSSPITRL